MVYRRNVLARNDIQHRQMFVAENGPLHANVQMTRRTIMPKIDSFAKTNWIPVGRNLCWRRTSGDCAIVRASKFESFVGIVVLAQMHAYWFSVNINSILRRRNQIWRWNVRRRVA